MPYSAWLGSSAKASRASHIVRTALLVLLVAVASHAVAHAQAAVPITYTLRFPEPQSHYLDVEAVIPSAGQTEVELMMAVWTPGSYLIREYARNLEDITARTPSGAPLTLTSTRKNRWRVATAGADSIVLTYRAYSREMSVRANWVDSDFALVNGAPTFITIADELLRPHDVTVELASGWNRSVTALPPTPDGRTNSYRAADFDTLLDSPIVAGTPAVYEFTVAGTPHYLVNIGEGGLWDGARAVEDVERLVREQHELWGSIPYDRYVFLNLITESAGGIEHKNSSVLMTSRWQMRDRERYLDWLTLVSHELFHAWNVKRLRPVELGPFDYENEVHTRSLWVAEGLTVYYGALIVHRAGLSSRDEYFAQVSDEIRRLQTTPGRLVQTVEQSSYDAWIKYYRQNENSRNTTVSYYTKGAVIGFLLDAKLRRMTGGARSLDDVMRLAYDRYSGSRGFTAPEFRATVEDALGTDADLDAWFDHVLETVKELEYSEVLDWFGLDLASSVTRGPDPDDDTPTAWVGLSTQADGEQLSVTQVRRGTPGFDAGFNVGDEILAIDDYRVRANGWADRLRLYRSGEEASVLIARRDRLLRLGVTFGARPQTRWELGPRSVQTAAQHYRVDAWLGTEP
jgi:predicted metalloprotease with PDZ domain